MKICADCRVELRCVKNGHLVITSAGAFDADRYACPRCGAEIIDGLARKPWATPADPDYQKRVDSQALYAGDGNVTTLDENWSTL